jgi:hypothetical protein
VVFVIRNLEFLTKEKIVIFAEEVFAQKTAKEPEPTHQIQRNK